MKLVKNYVSLIAACSLLLVLSACNSASLTGSGIPKKYKKVTEATIYEHPEFRDVFDVTKVKITTERDANVFGVNMREVYFDYTVTFKVDGEKLITDLRAKYPKPANRFDDPYLEQRLLWNALFRRYGAKFKVGDTLTIKDAYLGIEKKNGEWTGACVLPDLPIQ